MEDSSTLISSGALVTITEKALPRNVPAAAFGSHCWVEDGNATDTTVDEDDQSSHLNVGSWSPAQLNYYAQLSSEADKNNYGFSDLQLPPRESFSYFAFLLASPSSSAATSCGSTLSTTSSLSTSPYTLPSQSSGGAHGLPLSSASSQASKIISSPSQAAKCADRNSSSDGAPHKSSPSLSRSIASPISFQSTNHASILSKEFLIDVPYPEALYGPTNAAASTSHSGTEISAVQGFRATTKSDATSRDVHETNNTVTTPTMRSDSSAIAISNMISQRIAITYPQQLQDKGQVVDVLGEGIINTMNRSVPLYGGGDGVGSRSSFNAVDAIGESREGPFFLQENNENPSSLGITQQPMYTDSQAGDERFWIEGTEPASKFVYQVQFKREHRCYLLDETAPFTVAPGDFVVVEADRGEDLGIVVSMAPVASLAAVAMIETCNEAACRGSPEGPDRALMRPIRRLASPQERRELAIKWEHEMEVLEVAQTRARSIYQLPIAVVDAEYQFDRHKLTVYYSASRRVDFRELVRDLFTMYKTRIWMEHVTAAHMAFRPSPTAARALATGLPCIQEIYSASNPARSSASLQLPLSQHQEPFLSGPRASMASSTSLYARGQLEYPHDVSFNSEYSHIWRSPTPTRDALVERSGTVYGYFNQEQRVTASPSLSARISSSAALPMPAGSDSLHEAHQSQRQLSVLHQQQRLLQHRRPQLLQNEEDIDLMTMNFRAEAHSRRAIDVDQRMTPLAHASQSMGNFSSPEYPFSEEHVLQPLAGGRSRGYVQQY